MNRIGLTIILALFTLILVSFPIQFAEDNNVIASGTVELGYSLGPKQVYAKVESFVVEMGFDELPSVLILGKDIVFYKASYWSEPTLYLVTVNTENGEVSRRVWNITMSPIMASLGDTLYIACTAPNRIDYYRAGEGFGTIYINYTGNYKSINNIVPYTNRLYLELLTSDESHLVYGYIDLAESSENKSFHRILEVPQSSFTLMGELVTSKIWIFGDYKLFLENATYTTVMESPLFATDYKLSPDGKYAAYIIHGGVGVPDKIKIYDVEKGRYVLTIGLYEDYGVDTIYVKKLFWINNTTMFLKPPQAPYLLIKLKEGAQDYDVTVLKLISMYSFEPLALHGNYILGQFLDGTGVMGEIVGDKLYVGQKLYYKHWYIAHYMGSIGDRIVLVYRYAIYDKKMYVMLFEPTGEYVMPAYFKQISYSIIDTGDEYKVELTIHIQPSDKWRYGISYKCYIYGYPGGEIVTGEEKNYFEDITGNQYTIMLGVSKSYNYTNYTIVFEGYLITHSDIDYKIYTMTVSNITFAPGTHGGSGETTTTSTMTTTPPPTTTSTTTSTTTPQTNTQETTETTSTTQAGQEAGTTTTRGGEGVLSLMVIGALVIIVIVAAAFLLKKLL